MSIIRDIGGLSLLARSLLIWLQASGEVQTETLEDAIKLAIAELQEAGLIAIEEEAEDEATIHALYQIGWSREAARMLLNHRDDPAVAKLLRSLKRMDRSTPDPVTYYTKRPIPNRIRKTVFERDAYRCRHCGGCQDLTVDHITPEVAGGTLDLDNLQTLCRPCNSRKGAR